MGNRRLTAIGFREPRKQIGVGRASLILFLSFALESGGALAQHPPLASPRYDLQVRIADAADQIQVAGRLQLPVDGVSRESLNLNLANRMQDFGVFATVDGTSWPIVLQRRSVGKATSLWAIRPRSPFPAGHVVSLSFSYHGGGPTGTMFHVGRDITFASGWGSDWYPSIDGQKATGAITILVPAGDRAIASDRPLSTADEERRGIFRFAIVHPTFLTFAAGHFATTRTGTGTPIIAYTLQPRPELPVLLSGIAQVLHVLENEFGPFPAQQLALVEIPRSVAQEAGFNAASLPGMVLLNSNAFKAPKVDFLLEWLGHEISHQWFPHEVSIRTPPGLYMEEALAQYGGLTAVDALLGSAAAERSRRTGFEYDPTYSADAYFKLVKQGIDVPLSRLEEKPGHRDLAYNKGSFVFWMLADEVGRKRFRRTLRTITSGGFRELTWPQFLSAVEAGSGRRLSWFFDQWFDRAGAPDFTLEWHASGQRSVGKVRQTGPAYRAKLEIALKGAKGEQKTQIISVSGLETPFTIHTSFQPISVILDPHNRILRWLPNSQRQTPP